MQLQDNAFPKASSPLNQPRLHPKDSGCSSCLSRLPCYQVLLGLLTGLLCLNACYSISPEIDDTEPIEDATSQQDGESQDEVSEEDSTADQGSEGQEDSTEDDNNDTGNDDSNPDDDDSQPPPTPAEQLCEDGTDDDDDGLIDCEDPDCSGQVSCSWPEALDFHTELSFAANSTAQAFGVGDCVLEFAGVLEVTSEGNLCPACDATYQGAVAYGPDSCPQDYMDRPEIVAYGLSFISPGEREIWKRESDTGEWGSLGTWTPSPGGPYIVERNEPVFYDSFLGELEVGAFVMLQTFSDL